MKEDENDNEWLRKWDVSPLMGVLLFLMAFGGLILGIWTRR